MQAAWRDAPSSGPRAPGAEHGASGRQGLAGAGDAETSSAGGRPAPATSHRGGREGRGPPGWPPTSPRVCRSRGTPHNPRVRSATSPPAAPGRPPTSVAADVKVPRGL